MGWFNKIFSDGAAKVIEKVGDAIDKNVTNDEERLKLRNELARIELEADRHIEEQVTSRHAADMQSDNWMSKNIRPMSLVFLLSVVSVCAFTDGNIGQFKVQAAYVDLFKSLLMLAFGFYFGSRGIEKLVKTFAGNKR